VEKAQEEFEGISTSIRKEVERFELQRYEDFKEAIISYLESVLSNQQQVCTVYIVAEFCFIHQLWQNSTACQGHFGPFLRATARTAKRVLAIVIVSYVRLSRPGTNSSPGETETPGFYCMIAWSL